MSRLLVCDHCEKTLNTEHLPSSWITMVDKLFGNKFLEHHFCSWDCLASYRRKEREESSRKIS